MLVGLQQEAYFASEARETVMVCVNLTGQTERDVIVTLFTKELSNSAEGWSMKHKILTCIQACVLLSHEHNAIIIQDTPTVHAVYTNIIYTVFLNFCPYSSNGLHLCHIGFGIPGSINRPRHTSVYKHHINR